MNGNVLHILEHPDNKQINHVTYSNDSQRVLTAGNGGLVIDIDIYRIASNVVVEDSSPVIFADYLEDER